MSDKKQGGSVVRRKDFVRGIGLGSWHDTEAWNHSEKTVRTDKENHEALNITSYRHWGFGGPDSVKGSWANTGRRQMVTMPASGPFPGTVFADGTPSYGGRNYFDKEAQQKSLELFEPLKEFPHADEDMEALLLGNEDTWMCQRGNHMELPGYDPDTQREFRQTWLKERFGTVESLNALCHTDYAAFDEADPEANRLLHIEYWLFLRATFEDMLRRGVESVHAVNPDVKFAYAKFMGRQNPICDDMYLKFMDYGCQNLYWQWYRDTWRFSTVMDQLLGSSEGKPTFLSEFGMQNMFTLDGERFASRHYKQLLPIIYMRPQMQGVEIFCYSGQFWAHNTEDPEWSWGLTWPNRRKKLSFFAVKQVFEDFKMLDALFDGAMSSSPLVAMSNQLFDELLNGVADCEHLLRPLYANGVNVQFLETDNPEAFQNCPLSRLILNDVHLYQRPDGSHSIGQALETWLAGENRQILSFTKEVPVPYYGIGEAFTAADWPALCARYGEGKVAHSEANTLCPGDLWAVMAPFIHGAFVDGSVPAEPDKRIDESVVRILDTVDTAGRHREWDVQQTLLFANGHVYQAVVNAGETPIDELQITLGYREDAGLKWDAQVLCSGSEATVWEEPTPTVPGWMQGRERKVALKTLTVQNLDTYLFLQLS